MQVLDDELDDKSISLKGVVCGRKANVVPHVRACTNISQELKTRYKSELTNEAPPSITIPPTFQLNVASAADSCLSPVSSYSPTTSRGRSLSVVPSNKSRAHSASAVLPDTSYKCSRMSTGSESFDQEASSIDVLNLIAAMGTSFNFIENPETRCFFEKYIPEAAPITRQLLSGRILDKVTVDTIAAICRQVIGQYAMLMADGWKNNADVDVFTSTFMVDNVVCWIVVHIMCDIDSLLHI